MQVDLSLDRTSDTEGVRELLTGSDLDQALALGLRVNVSTTTLHLADAHSCPGPVR